MENSAVNYGMSSGKVMQTVMNESMRVEQEGFFEDNSDWSTNAANAVGIAFGDLDGLLSSVDEVNFNS